MQNQKDIKSSIEFSTIPEIQTFKTEAKHAELKKNIKESINCFKFPEIQTFKN